MGTSHDDPRERGSPHGAPPDPDVGWFDDDADWLEGESGWTEEREEWRQFEAEPASGHEGGYEPFDSRPRDRSEPPRRGRRPVALAVLAALVVVAVVALIVAVSGGGKGSPVTTSVLPTTTEQPVTTAPVTPTPTPTTTPGATRAIPSLSLPDAQALRQGDSGAAVVRLQKILNAVGFDAGTPDGKFGQQTEDAVVAFQDANGLSPDGIVGSETVRVLNDKLSAAQGG